MTSADDLAHRFTDLRPLLIRVAYSVLGSHAEAEDVVADTWPRLEQANERDPIADVQAWATVAVARRALDVLNSARLARESYVGPWLPEPLLGADTAGADPADRATLDETLSYALLVLLEALTPAERTSWVLHDVFGMEFADVAKVVGRSESAVRQLASRARRHIVDGRPRVPVTRAQHRAITEAFASACAEGRIDALLTLLDPDVVVTSDGGGEVVAARRPVHGAERVARFLVKVARSIHSGEKVSALPVNGSPGLVVLDGDNNVSAVIALTVDAGRIRRVDILRAPAKLTRLTVDEPAGPRRV